MSGSGRDEARVRALRRLGLEAPREGRGPDPAVQAELESLVRLTAHVTGVPLAAINLIDAERLWTAASAGMGPVVLPRRESFCETTAQGTGVLHVPDLSADPRFAGMSVVDGRDDHLRFYAGAPLHTADGATVGSLCVLDTHPRVLDDATLARLADLAQMVMTQFELRATLRERDDAALLRRALLENITVGVTLQDSDGRLLECNEAAEDLLQLRRGELGGVLQASGFACVRVDGRDLPVAELPGRVALRTGEAVHDELVGVVVGDGTTRWLRCNATPVQRAGERQVVTSFADVTESVIAHRELAERATELAVARDEAQRASREKSRFLATMSHEIRTPLNGVVGAVGLLSGGGGLTPLQAELAQTAQASGEALLSVVSDVLDLSKIEAGGLELEQIPVELDVLLAEATAVLSGQAAAKGLALLARRDDAVPPVLTGDPGRLRQALVNLLANAVKFTAAGTVTLDVARDPGDASLLRFAVTDTGIGVPAQVAARLFEPFRQADASTTRQHGGTGLGLTIVRELATLMGGTAGVSSVAGRGSTFWFTARLAPAAAAPVRADTRATGRDLAAARLLVVEDDPVNRRIATLMLERLGATVETVDDGLAALERIEAGGLDLVFMDMQLPGLDGPETTERLRAREAAEGRRRLPVLALTAAAFAEDRRRCLEAGMDGFLAKPLRPEELRDALVTHLAGQPTPA